MEYFKVEITETGRSHLKEEPSIFNVINETFNNLDAVKEFLADHYGRMPKGRKKIYVGDGLEIGFLHSFWNKDYSHNSKSWYQTDWIAITTKL